MCCVEIASSGSFEVGSKARTIDIYSRKWCQDNFKVYALGYGSFWVRQATCTVYTCTMAKSSDDTRSKLLLCVRTGSTINNLLRVRVVHVYTIQYSSEI